MKKWIAMIVIVCFAGSACAADFYWWGTGWGGDGVDFDSTLNWASDWNVQIGAVPGTNDFARIQATPWMSGYPVLSGSAIVGGLQLGLDNADFTPGASLAIEAGASLTTVTNYSVAQPANLGVQIGWYSDASITSAGTVDTGVAPTSLGMGGFGFGYGSANLTITDGSWTTMAVVFGTSNSVNTLLVEGGILTTGDIFFDSSSSGVNTVQIDGGTVEILAAGIGDLDKTNQTIDIMEGTLLLHSEDAAIINFYKTVGLTGYGSGDNILAVHSDTDADTTNDLWTVTAVDPAMNVYWHGTGSLGGDQSSWEDDENWSDVNSASVVGSPTRNDVVQIRSINGLGSYPVLSSVASVSGVQMGLVSGSSGVATLNIAATGQLLTTDENGINGGIAIGWYSDAEVTSAGIVDTLNGAGASGPTLLGLGDAVNGYGSGTLNITDGSWTTPSITFNTNSSNHVQLDGGTLTVGALNDLDKANQTMDITGGTLYYNTTDATWFASAKTSGLTGYDSSDSLVGSHDGSTWTVTAVISELSFQDAEWATAVAWYGSSGATLDSAEDVAGDPGYEFSCTTANFMMFGVDLGTVVASNWTVRVKNTGTFDMTVAQLITVNYPSVIRDFSGEKTLAPGEEATLSVDVSSYASIEKLGLVLQHTTTGSARPLKVQVIEPPPPVVDLKLLDAHWEKATANGWPGAAGSSLDSSSDVAGDPGYEFSCTVASWGQMLGVDSAVIGTLTPGVWEVWIKNTSPETLAFEQVAYINGSATFISENGGSGVPLAAGASALFSWDLSSATSIEKLGITAGIAGTGTGEITFRVVQAPLSPSANIVLRDTEWDTATGDWGTASSTFDGGVDVAGDPGFEFTCTAPSAADRMIFGVNMGGVTGETWKVTVENSGTSAMSVQQAVWSSDGRGGLWTFSEVDNKTLLSPGEQVLLTADISTNTSVERLGLIYYGTDGGGVEAKAKVVYTLSPAEAYETWAASFPGTGGLIDDDENGGVGDGLDNLREYAFGGDPLVDDRDTYGAVTVSAGGDTYVYVYRRRIDAEERGLEYDLQYKQDLSSEIGWISVTGFYETTAILDSDFEVVTNSIPTAGLDKSFLKLKISATFD